MRSTNRVPLSYELTAANVAEVKLTEELLAEAGLGDEGDLARKLFGDLAYRSEALEEALAQSGILLVTERSRQGGKRQQVEIALASLKREFRIGETLATTLVGLGHQDRGEDSGLHLRPFRQPGVGPSSRKDQRTMGLNLPTHI